MKKLLSFDRGIMPTPTICGFDDWTLSAKSTEIAAIGECEINRIPFRIGRQHGLELTIPIPTVSGVHATIVQESDGQLSICDSGSRNGTFVNGIRVAKRQDLKSGDLIQIAESVFRLEKISVDLEPQTINTDDFDDANAIIDFEMLMSEHLVTPHFQSIVSFKDDSIYGFEALARGSIESLRSPKAMFDAAERMQQEVQLSQLLRRLSAQAAEKHGLKSKLFLNTHYEEITQPKVLVESVAQLRSDFPSLDIVLEIHESTVTDLSQMQFICQELKKLGTDLAYDDFGAGQARFFELVEEPPAYLKFDIRLIRGIHKASARRLKTLEGLVKMVKGLEIVCLAEGLEVEEDVTACRNLGFDMAQGYYFMYPEPFDKTDS